MTESVPLGYTLFAVLAGPRPRTAPGDAALAELESVVAGLAADGVTLRGFYDVTGMRAEADLMVWLHTTPGSVDDPAQLQQALRALRRTTALAAFENVWSAMGVHREAEFNKRHVPGYLRGEHARGWLCLYPFVRTPEWYLAPEEERRKMLADHGRKGAAFTGVLANTVASFALGDYEWLLPLEADELTDLVDMMRDLRYTDARMYVKEEVPFYTGRRLRFDEIADVLQ